MILPDNRSNVVSSYTIVKGALIEESYSILAAWDFEKSKKQNLDELRRNNFIQAKSYSWLLDIAKVFNRRFDPIGRDRSLTMLAKSGCSIEEWRPILLWHLTRDEFLLKDFLIYWLFSVCYASDAYSVQSEDLHIYLLGIGKRGKIEHAWTHVTLHRVATALIRIAIDFGLLHESNPREFASYQLPERSFIYILHAIKEKYSSGNSVLNALEWRIFLMCPSDVERELVRLNQDNKLKYESTVSKRDIYLPCKNAYEYAERMSELYDFCIIDGADKTETSLISNSFS